MRSSEDKTPSSRVSLELYHARKAKDQCRTRLSDHGGGGGALVPPGRGQDANGLVVAGQAVDAGLDENEAELAVLVLAVALEVLADGDGLGTVSVAVSPLQKLTCSPS